MDGQYGDSTRSVKAVGSEAGSGPTRWRRLPVPASTYHLSPDETEPLDSYGRSSNPTWRQLESALAELEGAATALTFGSGMAAITSVLRVLAKPGTKLVVPADGYYQVRAYATEYPCPARGDGRRGAAAPRCAPRRRTPTWCSPKRRPIPDSTSSTCTGWRWTAAAAAPTLVVDNTTATPLGQQPLSLGADLVVASATKALSGHSDLLAGYVAGSHADLMAAVERERLLAGPILGAFEAWLVLRSLGSAGLRFERQCHNAQALAVMLRAHPAVRSVRYPGLPDDPSHQVATAADEAVRRTGRRGTRGRARRCTSWWIAVHCWSRRPASAASTPRWTAARGGATRSATASPASRWASRTPTT